MENNIDLENLKLKVFIHVEGNKVTAISKQKSDDAIEIEIFAKEFKNYALNIHRLIYMNNSLQILEIDELKIIRKKELKIEIKKFKTYLINSDYKITKCYEASMMQEPLPYNLQELSAQRNAWRQEINKLEEELKNYEEV